MRGPLDRITLEKKKKEENPFDDIGSPPPGGVSSADCVLWQSAVHMEGHRQ